MFGEIAFRLPGAYNNKTFSFNSLFLTSLTPNQAVVTNANNLLTSLAYTSANTASTLIQRDSSGNFAAGTISSTFLTSAAGTNLVMKAASGQTTQIGDNVTTSINNSGGSVFIGAGSSASGISIGNTTGMSPLTLAGAITVSSTSTLAINAPTIFGSTVTLNANAVLPLQAVPLQQLTAINSSVNYFAYSRFGGL